MKLPCKISAKYVIPAIRLMIARKLIEEYNLTQSEAARLLGVSQPSISHYLNSKRGIMMRALSKLRYVDRYVKEAVLTGAPPKNMTSCMMCRKVMNQMMNKKGLRAKSLVR